MVLFHYVRTVTLGPLVNNKNNTDVFRSNDELHALRLRAPANHSFCGVHKTYTCTMAVTMPNQAGQLVSHTAEASPFI
jgi:hypothetical protein